MVYPTGYTIPSDTVPWDGMGKQGLNTISFNRYGTGPNDYHTMVWYIRGTVPRDDIFMGYPTSLWRIR